MTSQKTIEDFVNELCDWDASDERRDYWIKELTSLVKQAQIEAERKMAEFVTIYYCYRTEEDILIDEVIEDYEEYKSKLLEGGDA